MDQFLGLLVVASPKGDGGEGDPVAPRTAPRLCRAAGFGPTLVPLGDLRSSVSGDLRPVDAPKYPWNAPAIVLLAPVAGSGQVSGTLTGPLIGRHSP